MRNHDEPPADSTNYGSPGDGTAEALPHRRDIVRVLLEKRGDLLVVAGLGAPAWDCAAAGDHPLTFPLWGGMGQAAMTGLGLALARPNRRVVVITGDGELLMGLGSLATIAVQRPRNLTVVVLDNGRYGETGMQRSHTSFATDLAGVAAACGFPYTRVITTMAEAHSVRDQVHGPTGPNLVVVKVAVEKPPLVLPPREGVELKDRFRAAL